MRLHKSVFIGMVIVFTGIFALPAGSFACWFTGGYELECCFVCCETETDCNNYLGEGFNANCTYNWYCLFNPAYCLESCPEDWCSARTALNNDPEKIDTLRRFRDEVLSKTPLGREYITLYYRWSPVVVQMMQEDEELKEEVQILLEELLPLIKEMLE